MNRLLLSLFTVLVCAAIPAAAQMDDGGGSQDDSITVDSLYNEPMDPDTAYQYSSDPYDSGDQGYGYNDEGEYDYNSYDYEPAFFSTRNGLMVGPTIQFTELRPKDLDPDLSGEFVFFGGEIIAAVNGHSYAGGTEILQVTDIRDGSSIELPWSIADGQRAVAKVWDDPVEVIHASEQTADWFSERLEASLSLVFMPDDSQRPTDERYAEAFFARKLLLK